jgi:NAD-dependent dihydropyrimidine dehydrogenase PreA subunit
LREIEGGFRLIIIKEVLEMSKKVYMKPNPPLPSRAVEINSVTCTGCNMCVDICPHDLLMPNPVKKQPPIVLYPEECWSCGSCVEECPFEGVITMHHPLKQNVSVRWKRKKTGEIFRLGMKNPPAPNTRPPSGDAYKTKKKPKSKKSVVP